MIELIIGKMGSGKTKRIIEMVNKYAVESKGDIVFIDDDKRYMYDIKHEVRFISADDYDIGSKEKFLGFIYGILATNFDVSAIYIDGFLKIIGDEAQNIEEYIKKLASIFEGNETRLVINISTENPPEFMKPYQV